MTTLVASAERAEDSSRPPHRTRRPPEPGAGVGDSVLIVSRPVRSWRWFSVLLAPLELLAVVWSIPFVILLIGIPIALAVALVYWIGRLALSLF